MFADEDDEFQPVNADSVDETEMYGGDIWDDNYDWTETALRHYDLGYQEQL